MIITTCFFPSSFYLYDIDYFYEYRCSNNIFLNYQLASNHSLFTNLLITILYKKNHDIIIRLLVNFNGSGCIYCFTNGHRFQLEKTFYNAVMDGRDIIKNKFPQNWQYKYYSVQPAFRQ